MDGSFLNKNDRHEEIIESWMRTIIRDGGITRYDDLHIDRIDHEWGSRNLWVSSAFHVYDLAVNVRNRCKLEFSVVMVFSLKVSKEPTGIDFYTRDEFEAQLDQSPPSLYLFQRGREPWTAIKDGVSDDLFVQKMSTKIFGSLATRTDCWYMQFKHNSVNGYSRSVFVTARGN